MSSDLIWLQGVSLRAVNALENAGITTEIQLAEMTLAELRAVRGIGEQCAYELWRAIGREIDTEVSVERCSAGHAPS